MLSVISSVSHSSMLLKNDLIFQVQLQAPVNIRVSYHDVEIFRRILDSARSQIQNALQGESQSAGEFSNCYCANITCNFTRNY